MPLNKIKALVLLMSVFAVTSSAQEVSFPDALNEPPSNSIGFVKNNGQVLDVLNQQRPDIHFQSVHASPSTFYLNNKVAFVYMSKVGQDELEDTVRKVEMTWKYSDVGNSVIPYGVEETDETFNYYLAHCNTSACTNIKKQRGLVYENIYTGIDMRVYSNETFLKYYFVMDGTLADPDDIALTFDGYDNVTVFNNNIVINSGSQVLVVPTPIAYQLDQNNQVIPVTWKPQYEQVTSNRVRIRPNGTYDRSKRLVYQIGGRLLQKTTPEQRNLEWSTYFGGSGSKDEYWDIETNPSGQVYVTGYAYSTNFPITPGASQINLAGASDIVVFKFDNNLKLLWSTYHGGSKSDGDIKHGITVDNAGNAYVAASTTSINIPLLASTNVNAYYDYDNSCFGGDNCRDNIIVKYNSNGQMLWSTFFGGAATQGSETDIFIDNNNFLYVTGMEGGGGMPYTTLSGAYNSMIGGAYIARFNANLELDWCAGFGSEVFPKSIIKTNDNKLLIAGLAYEDALPVQTLSSAYNQLYGGGGWDAFVARFNTNLNLEWATYFGGAGEEQFTRLNVDPNIGSSIISLIGYTNSSNFPVVSSVGFVQSSYAGPNDPYADGDICLVQFNGSGSLAKSTYYGGTSDDNGYGVASYFGQVFVAGKTKSTNFPLLASSLHSNTLYYNSQFYNSGGGSMGYVLGFDKFTDRKWTTYYGGQSQFGAFDGAIIHSLKFANPYLYFTGSTQAIDFFPSHSTPGAYNSSNPSGGLVGRFKMSNTILNVQEVAKLKEYNRLYPNPTNGLVQISDPENINSLRVINVVGQEVLVVEQATNQLDIKALTNGVYVVEVIGKNKEVYYTKLIKN